MRSRSSGGGRSHSSSRSSGGRSHFSSSRSSSSSRSHSSIHIGGPRHTTYYHGHHHGPVIHSSVHINGPFGAILTVIIAYVVIFIIPLVSSFASNTRSLDEITTSYYYYQDMIDYAQQHASYKMQGVVKGIYQDYNYEDAWYIKYTVYSPSNPNRVLVTEYTFSVYTEEDIAKIRLGDTIWIAVDNPNPPILDSIDMNYGNVPLENDPEYALFKAKRNTLITTFTIYGIIATSIAGLIIFFVIKHNLKKSKTEDSTEENTTSTSTPIEEKPKARYCAYCGGALENGSNKCNNCGARNDN